jgi:hypothetical protein
VCHWWRSATSDLPIAHRRIVLHPGQQEHWWPKTATSGTRAFFPPRRTPRPVSSIPGETKSRPSL